MDVTVCREVLSNLLEALRVLEETDAEEERYRQLLAALPAYEINAEVGCANGCMRICPTCRPTGICRTCTGCFPAGRSTRKIHRKFHAWAVRALELRQSELGSMAGWSFSFMANLWAAVEKATKH
jgi:hypothetical protein